MAGRSFFRRSLRISRYRSDVPRDVADELDLHLELKIEELIEDGLDPAEAERRARQAFGDRARFEAECQRLGRQVDRRRRRLEAALDLLRDLRFFARDVRRHPAHFTLMLLTLMIATALHAAVFSLAYTVVWKPLPYAEPE
ncbi:MAG: permease prefix domain 1-containing protein, partial [Holophagales bacterium]|nr:permease prefix domain 1-containing protein [Holophagales bacterium]